MDNLYVSAILNFQKNRGRPIEYYTTPINDLAKQRNNIIVYVDDTTIYNKLSSNIHRKMIKYQDISNFVFEESWRVMFLKYFNNDEIWYNLSRTYLLKPRLLKLAQDHHPAARYTWVDAGWPCSHIYEHSFDKYVNLYTEKSVQYMESVFSSSRFLSQGWVVNQQSGVNMKIIYDALKLTPNGREHVSGCIFSLENSIIDKFNLDFYNMLYEFYKLKFAGTDENVYIAMLSKDPSYVDDIYVYSEFMNKMRGIINEN